MLDFLEEEARRDGAHCLVALSVRALEGHPAHAALVLEEPGATLPMRAANTVFPLTQGDLLIQVAAPEFESGLRLLRKAQRTLETFCWLDVELLGGRIGDGREAFGFRDGLHVPSADEIRRDAMISSGPAAGASWLLYQRWVQDRERFLRLREPRQADIVGRWPDGEEKTGALPNAHVLLQRPGPGHLPRMVRRGFPFRSAGREGLCFVAASRSVRELRAALEQMIGDGQSSSDAMLPYVVAVEGGVYVAPPDSRWLAERADSGSHILQHGPS